MNDRDMLEFNKIVDALKNYALTDKAKEKLEELIPIQSKEELTLKMQDTTDARRLLDTQGSPPLAAVDKIRKITKDAQKGQLLSIEDLERVAKFAVLCSRLMKYLNKDTNMQNSIAAYGKGMQDLDALREEIEQCIRNERVDDSASTQLRDIRRKIARLETNIKLKCEAILKSKKGCFSESFVSNRNGHYTLPVKKEYKFQISGSVIDTSSSGATLFMEPSSVSKLRDERNELQIAENNEERRVLYTLMCDVADFQNEILLNLDYVEELDYIFAKAKLSYDMRAVCPSFNQNRVVSILNGRHPLISAQECVPLTISFGNQTTGVVITGPNTGGKTVALKTVGLLSMMAQCGLHIPCEQADICMNSSILCDIGDGQSITENLSTFSAHIKNVIRIMGQVNQDSLVLMDELGSGTDPSEGMGIAISILEELRESGCNFIATTHYPQVKTYAKTTGDIVNARMAFDKENLKPLYQLEIGEAGESCAFYIAERLGMPKRMLQRAYRATYAEDEAGLSGEKKIKRVQHSSFVRKSDVKNTSERAQKFEIGDSVLVYPEKKIGIVFEKTNGKGEVGVQIKKEKRFINHKRLKLRVAAKDLYPEDYDFSIIFDTVENRKARHLMEKRHVEGNEIKYTYKDTP